MLSSPPSTSSCTPSQRGSAPVPRVFLGDAGSGLAKPGSAPGDRISALSPPKSARVSHPTHLPALGFAATVVSGLLGQAGNRFSPSGSSPGVLVDHGGGGWSVQPSPP